MDRETLRAKILQHKAELEAYAAKFAARATEEMQRDGYSDEMIQTSIEEQRLWSDGMILGAELDIFRLDNES